MLWTIVADPAFMNGLGIFTGIVAGVLIQLIVNSAQNRRFARNALRVLKTEVAYNTSEVENLKSHIAWLKQRISSGQISENDLFLPMQKFDYSSIGPLTNSGHFHMMLGPEKFRAYLEFNYFFRTDNGAQLTRLLKAKHETNESMAFLEWVESRADELVVALKPIENAKLPILGQMIKLSRS